jgi:uncharacterized protein YhaN
VLTLKKRRILPTVYLVGWGIALWVNAQALGLGLGITGVVGEKNYYYSVEGAKLYRYFCPPNTVPTSETCSEKDPSFLISYSSVRTSLSQHLKDQLEQTVKLIKQEVTKLKEADPEAQRMRKAIRDALSTVGTLERKHTELTQQAALAEKNLSTVKSELKVIVAKLTTDLPQEELLRTVEVHTERTKQKAEFEAKLKSIDTLVAAAIADIETANEQVTRASVELGTLLPTLVVQSTQLITLQKTKIDLEAQIELLPELDKRLTDPVAYPLNAWIETGTPGVEALVKLFETNANRMSRGEVVSRSTH